MYEIIRRTDVRSRDTGRVKGIITMNEVIGRYFTEKTARRNLSQCKELERAFYESENLVIEAENYGYSKGNVCDYEFFISICDNCFLHSTTWIRKV